MLNRTVTINLLVFSLLVVLLAGCGKSATNRITLYASVDPLVAEPILKGFLEKNPEWKLNSVFASEEAPATGAYQQLMQEKENPQADVFWNEEILRTIQLKKAGMLAPYASPSAGDIPAQYKDPEGTWTGFSARARVMLINKNLVVESETPASIPALGDPKYRGKTCMARPEFGTALTHMAALYTVWGKGILQLRLGAILQNQTAFPHSDRDVCDAVVRGEYAYGVVDTDDAFTVLDSGQVRMAFLDQTQNGTLLIPNTVALIQNSPNPEGGKKLIDYLLSADIEGQLAQSRLRQIPLRPSVPRPEGVPDLATVKVLEVDYNQAADHMEPCLELLRSLLP